jgi:hypothetical protein
MQKLPDGGAKLTNFHRKVSNYCHVSLPLPKVTIWWLPEIGVPPVLINFNGMFHYKPTIFGYLHFRKP